MPGDRVIPPPATEELPARIETLGAVLKKQGYATAHFGKWHVGRVNPSEHGFDESDGPNNNGGPDEVEDPNPKQCHAIAGLAVDFISRQTKVGKPFYVQLSEYPGRGLHPASPEKIEAVKVRLGNRLDYARISTAAGDEEIDDSIGVVLAKLKELGLMENTYVVYTADHGAQGRRANGMLTNGKGTVWEGGLRVPLLVCGPGIKAGGFTHVRASTVDLFPTLSELAGVKAESLPAELEGGSLKAVWMGEKNPLVKRPREEWVVHFPHYDKDDSGPASALFLGSLKLIRFYETDQRRLFDLSSDLSEQQDLAAKESEKREALEQRLTDYLSWVGAGLPVPNPHYVPGGERSGDRGSGGGGRKENRPRASESKPPVPVPAP
jgi:arylsulfatase A-like enzyme